MKYLTVTAKPVWLLQRFAGCACIVATTALPVAAQQTNMNTTKPLSWPTISREARPWTRWWWMGSAVDEAEITRHLQLFREAGIGGVEISPLYGVQGEEKQNIPFLSPRWMDMLGHTLREAKRLDMGVDMITGTGWPFGGPWVLPADVSAQVLLQTFALSDDGKLARPVRHENKAQAKLLALMAYSNDGRVLDISGKVDEADNLQWTAPHGTWKLHAAFLTGTGQDVKRAAPGGEGKVFDHFSGVSTNRYLEYFDEPFSRLSQDQRLRAFFNDSYEVFGANVTDNLFDEFSKRRGYDLRNYLPALQGTGDADVVSRVRSDYRETIGELLLDGFVQQWAHWAHGKGSLARHQAHGSPGNLLDLYAATDIPETEVFGTAWLELAGLDPLPGTPRRYGGREEILACKLASSAAHVAGKPLCSSESMTWLGEHGQVPLEHVKAEVDSLFVMGVNHVFFHGTSFSPERAEWPGWLFYASTHFGPTNPFWRDLPELNHYIARCQSFLQTGQPDNDVLLYLPYYELLAKEAGARDMLQFMTVHDTEQWLDINLANFAKTGRLMWDRGYSFDCVSDQLLQSSVSVSGTQLKAKSGSYRTLLVPESTLMPPQTLERMVELARNGATIIVAGALPSDVPGLGNLEARRQQLRAAVTAIDATEEVQPGIVRAVVGKGQFLIGQDVEKLLQFARVPRESIVDSGIELIRRRGGNGEYSYFLTNLGGELLDDWTTLANLQTSAALFDPATGYNGVTPVRQHEGQRQVYLRLEPGESLLLRTQASTIDGPAWKQFSPFGEPHTLTGNWKVEFLEGGPQLPSPMQIRELSSWTTWTEQQESFQAFSGTARYTILFDRPAGKADAWELDLGKVLYSARVRLNGQPIGTTYARPYRLRLDCNILKSKDNPLEIEVTNLMANRLADLDKRKVAWQKFFFVNIQYQPFSAADWTPLPSGLLGPVRLVPLGAALPS